MKEIKIDTSIYLELQQIHNGTFAPLNSFMDHQCLESVIETMSLPDSHIFSIPILFPISNFTYQDIKFASEVKLIYRNKFVGKILINNIYNFNLNKIFKKLFGTKNEKHPGIIMMRKMGNLFLSGKVTKSKVTHHSKFNIINTPKDVKKIIKKLRLKTIAGFQTRNIPHKAHEFIHRLALEQVDGLLIQPIIGKKKEGDFTSSTVIKTYKHLINNYYPKNKVILSGLSTSMRYAGPREALFHAIIRRNFGCTHFIVGRDHAGVEQFYKEYEAQELCLKMEKKLGIKILPFKGPYFCKKCDTIVTENSCPHKSEKKTCTLEISGTKIRAMLKGEKKIDTKFLRKDIANLIDKDKAFIRRDDD